MSIDRWTSVDEYFDKLFMEDDPILKDALVSSEKAQLPAINVAPNQGKLLYLMAKMIGARNILEIGTLGGYSTIWLARATPADGTVTTLEYEQVHADVARKNIANAGLEDKVTVIQGAALDTLPTLASKAPFDLIFIDADKPNNPHYYDWALRYAHSGTVIFLDNVVRNGEVANPISDDESVMGTRQVSELIASDDRVEAMAIQTVGSKGYDGFALIRVK